LKHILYTICFFFSRVVRFSGWLKKRVRTLQNCYAVGTFPKWFLCIRNLPYEVGVSYNTRCVCPCLSCPLRSPSSDWPHLQHYRLVYFLFAASACTRTTFAQPQDRCSAFDRNVRPRLPHGVETQKKKTSNKIGIYFCPCMSSGYPVTC
jgi:hypothetical protein